ncbi:unnamed protein product [Boreogadus saida]
MEEHQASLRDILDHSPFNTEEELLTELRAIESSGSSTGTRIIIWNLRSTSSGKPAIDFITDRYDIRVPCDDLDSSDPDSKYSLRAYCSVLYMKPRMQINIRGLKVKTQLISKSLAHSAKDFYKPPYVKQKIPITFGYNTKSKEHYGLMMYHKNRLIKAYNRVGCQKDANNKQGIGVIGVIECNFLEPTHNKQDFDNTDKFRNTIRNVKVKLEEYCKEIAYKGKDRNLRNKVVKKFPDQNWAQCDECQQWRRMPDGINHDKLPEEWFCNMNPDPQFRRCETMEEPEDSDSEQPTNPKTYKIQEKEEKKKQEQMKELKKFQEEKKQQELLLKAEDRRRERELRKMTSTPNTPQTPGKGASASGVSTSSSQLVITDVFSPSKTPSRLKRLQPTTPQNESKRQKLDDLKRKLVTDMSLSSSMTLPTPVPCKDLNIYDDPLEGSSTSEMTEPTFQPFEVRLESDPMDSRKSFVDEPTVTYTSTQMRDEEEMRDKSIQICDEEVEMRDKSTQILDEEEEEEEVEMEMRDKSIQILDEEEEEEMRDKSIQILDEEEEEEVEMRDKSIQILDEEEEEEEEMRDKSIQILDEEEEEEEEMRDKCTQMQGPRVKDEMEEMRDKRTQILDEDEEDEGEMRDKSTQMQGPRVKDEEEMNSSTAANDGAKVMEEGMISIIQAQEEQDQLMELLQSVSNERDSFKEEVKELHAQVKELQLQLEKQCADCQTAREKAEKLSREKEDLTCRLDQSSKEMEKLQLKMKQLEEEKATTAVEPQDHGRVKVP